MAGAHSTYRRLFFDAIASRGDEPVLVSPIDAQSISGNEAITLADRAVAELATQGVGPGDRLLLKFDNGLDLALAYLACLRGRVVAIPVAPDTPQGDFDYIVDVTRPKLIAGDAGGEKNFFSVAELRISSVVLTSAPFEASSAPDDLFSITMTSGTTARPKAVAHYAERILANAHVFARASSFGQATRMFHVMPMYYMAGILNTILCPLIAGGTTVLGPAFSPRSALGFWRAVEENRIDAVWLSPTMLQMAMKLDRRPSDHGRYVPKSVYVGTAPLPPAVSENFVAAYGTPTLHSYGLSELLLISSEQLTQRGGVGPILPGVELRFAQDGGLEVKTAYSFAGYLDPTTSVLIPAADGFVPTGDLARVNEHDCLEITGRKKDLIIVGGVNVSPVYVEHLLGKHPAIESIAVLGTPDPILGEKIVAVIVLKPGILEEAARAELVALALSDLPSSARPASYIFRQELPAGPTGKIQKHVLKRDLCL